MTADTLATILRRSRTILLDFDGPVCSVFAGYPAPQIGNELRTLVRELLGAVPDVIANANGPHQVLAASARFEEDLWRPIEDALQLAEIKAVASATETPGIRALLNACKSAERPVAIVSNNCEDSIRAYLDHNELSSLVQHIEGRDPNHTDRMKPSPFLLDRATAVLGVESADAAFVGDQVSDVEAAIAAGVRSIGYANKPGKSEHLAEAGADVVVDNMGLLAVALSDIL